MTVIERKECPMHGNHTGITWTEHGVTRCGATTSTSVNCAEELVTVEYVRAATYQRAVEDRDELRRAIEDVVTNMMPPSTVERRLREALRITANRKRGQS